MTWVTVDRNVNESFSFNKETEFIPILGLEEKLNGTTKNKKESEARPASSIYRLEIVRRSSSRMLELWKFQKVFYFTSPS